MEIKDTVVLNGPILVHVVDNTIKVHSSNTLSYSTTLIEEEVYPIERIIQKQHKGIQVKISSDVLDVSGYTGTLEVLNQEVYEDIFHKLMLGTIQFIGKISKEYDTPILIQNTFFEKTKRFLSTIGLLDDIRIIYIDIEPIEKENNEIC
jgi:hypothetical protein